MRSVPLRRRKLVAAIGVGASLLVGVSGCTSAGSTGSPSSGTSKEVLNLSVSTTPQGWNPAAVSSATDLTWLWHAVYDTVLSCKPDGTVQPGFATSYTFTEGNKVLTLKLPTGRKFQDGTAEDAAAVKASIENMQNGGGTDASRVAGLDITTPDASTVVLTSKVATPLLPTFLCLAPGIVASPKALSSSTKDSVPVSSGPYQLDSSATTSGSVYTLTKRAGFRDPSAYPYKKIVVKVITDATARLNALKSGQLDAATLDQQTAPAASGSNLSVKTVNQNWAGLILADRNGKVAPAMKDERVRQAINMVFDRKTLAKSLYSGAQATSEIAGPTTDAYDGSVADYYAFDVSKAKSLMKEAGYANGFSVEIPTLAGITDLAMPVIVQQLKELNITVKQVPLSGATALVKLLSGRFPIIYIPLQSSGGLWDMIQSVAPTSIWNTNKATDPEVDALVSKISVTSSEAEQKPLLQQLTKLLVQKAWFAPFAYTKAYIGTKSAGTFTGDIDLITGVPPLSAFK